MNYNENPPEELLEKMFLDGMTEEYLKYLCLQAEYEQVLDAMRDRTPMSRECMVEVDILTNDLMALRADLADHRKAFSNNPFRYR